MPPSNPAPAVYAKTFSQDVIPLASGGSTVVDARGMATLTVIAGAGATVTVSRVDSATAVADSTDTQGNFTVAAGAMTATPVDWPFYRVTSAGGAARVGVV
jgi:hypothetical protein